MHRWTAYRLSALALPLLASACVGTGMDSDADPLSSSTERTKQFVDSSEDLGAEGLPNPAIAAHWERFEALARGPLAVHWSARDGYPEGVFGLLSDTALPKNEAGARSFLEANARLFGLRSDLSDLEFERRVESPLGVHLVFQQSLGGIPVYGAKTAVHLNQAGEVVGVSNTAVPGVTADTFTPTVRAEQALQRATSELLLSHDSEISTGLVFYAPAGEGWLAWHITATAPDATWELFVDATTGDLLGAPRDINRYVNGSGQIFRDNAVVATQNNTLRDGNDSASAVPSSAYSVVTLQGLTGSGKLDGQYASSSANKSRASSTSNTFIYDRSKTGFNETMGYYFIDYAERYIQSLGFTNVNNRQQVFSTDKSVQDNSSYSPSTKKITYGTGGVDDAEDAEVILHEYGHSIQDNQVPGFGSSAEAGAMGEGFGDYWGGTVGAQFSNGYQDVCVADWDATSYSSANPPCLRRLDSTKHYPQDMQGEVHADGEIWSAALWQIRTAVGTAKSDKVIIQAHFLLSPSASFNQAANAIVTSAINLGYSTAEVDAIRTILRNRGFTVTV